MTDVALPAPGSFVCPFKAPYGKANRTVKGVPPSVKVDPPRKEDYLFGPEPDGDHSSYVDVVFASRGLILPFTHRSRLPCAPTQTMWVLREMRRKLARTSRHLAPMKRRIG